MKTAWTAVIAGFVGLFAGILLAQSTVEMPAPFGWVQGIGEQSLSDEVTELVEDYYWRSTDTDQLERSSVEGIVDQLRRRYRDRFTHYFDPKQLETFNEAIEGTFSGVGMTVGDLVEGGLVVGRVFGDSPAERGGIETGDLIVSVDGESIAGDGVDSVVMRIKGPEGTPVVLGVKASGEGSKRSVRLVREEIQVPVSEGRILERDGQKIGYVSLAGFSEGAGTALEGSLRKVTRRGAEGIVLDLRGNGGGLLPEAISTSSLFAPKGRPVVETRSRVEGNRIYRTEGGELDLPPVVVLMDRGTASAAEILAAVVRKYGNAPLVGTRSFGKGLFQQLIELEGGGALDLSIGEFLTAEGESLAGKGLRPDVAVSEGSGASDAQLGRAIRILRDRTE
ncbi:MAG: S41 family peptidase [Solirubrobacterales bacterium]|nr:S41 family peptidase [Solirubrobacterales bacterium]